MLARKIVMINKDANPIVASTARDPIADRLARAIAVTHEEERRPGGRLERSSTVFQ